MTSPRDEPQHIGMAVDPTTTTHHDLIKTAPPNRLVKARDGYMIVNENDIYIGKSLIKYGEYSQLELDLFSQIVRETDTVIEVGSNIGSHTLGLCRLAGRGRVFAIEPQRIPFQSLCGNIAINSVLNCHCMQAACSDVLGAPIFIPELNFTSPANFGGVSMIKCRDQVERHTAITLDASLPKIDELRLL